MGSKKKIALVGGGKSKILTPVGDKSIEKWVLPISCPRAIPYASLLFDLHSYIWDIDGPSWSDIKGRDKKRNAMRGYRQMLKRSKVPVYMTKHYKDIPMSRPFPFKEIVEKFGPYFDNSVSWMIAFAILKCAEGGYNTIQMYGMEFNEERHTFGKGVCEFYLGIIQGMKSMGFDINLEIAPGSSLLKTHDGLLYGIHKKPVDVLPELKAEYEAEMKTIEEFETLVKEKGVKDESISIDDTMRLYKEAM
jgi:hypothetical protein